MAVDVDQRADHQGLGQRIHQRQQLMDAPIGIPDAADVSIDI